MKQLIMTLIIALMSVMASTPVSAKSNKSELKKSIPTNLIVKQTTQFSDGRTLVIYYKKQGMNCEVYSPCNADDYSVSDASKIKSTNFEVVDKVEGKLYKKASIGEVTKLIELPDRREYKTIEERAEKALAFARRHNMNEHYALFVDYGIPSGTPRLFVWDFQQQKIVASTYVMHGPGGGSTAERPRFSNLPGSECSSLGRFLITKDRGNRLKRSFRLKGMEIDNQSAYARGLMIHSSGWVDKWCWKKHIPLHRASCKGCVTVSSRGMNYLWPLINKEKKPMLLWSFVSKQS